MATNQSQYKNLGQFNFTTAPDQSGLNAGNMTSTFDTGTFKPAVFELYRLVIGVASIPSAGQTPMVVQVAEGWAGSLTTLDLTFPATTTKGNLIVVGVAGWGDTDNPAVSGVTIGGSADNFAVVPSTSSIAISDNAMNTVLWADPDSATAGTAIVVTATSGSGTHPNLIGFAWEVAGTTATATVATATDVTGTSRTVTTAVTSLVTSPPVTTAANDIVFAIAGTTGRPSQTITYGGAITEQTPQGGFTIENLNGLTEQVYGNAGYVLVPSSGGSTSQTVSFTGSGSNGWFSQSVAAFFAATASPAPTEIPFTVMIGNKTWDIQQTTAGVGFTYDPQNAMYLNQGEQLNVLWTNLSSDIYGAYANNFTVTASFRYDPTLPGNTI
jgi:hypothetical protein